MLGGELAKLDSAHFGGLLAALADANDFKGKEVRSRTPPPSALNKTSFKTCTAFHSS